jgi:hypothetical protein
MSVNRCWMDVYRKRVRPVELLRRLEMGAVDLERLHQDIRREMRGEGERQPEHPGELRPEEAGSEDPERHVRAGARHGLNGLSRLERAEISLQLENVLWKGVCGRGIATQGAKRQSVRARRTTQAEVDATRIQGRQRPELLRDHQR